MKPSTILIFAFTLLICGHVDAKSTGNRPYVAAFRGHSPFYARCIPTEATGAEGTTTIIRVDPEGDKIVTRFNWYNRNGIELGWSPKAGKVAVMRVRQDEGLPPDQQTEFSFYLGDQFLRSYTTEDLITLGAKLGGNPHARERGLEFSKRAVYELEGCKQAWNTNDYYFNVRLDDTKTLSFDITTGVLCRVEKDGRKQRLVLSDYITVRDGEQDAQAKLQQSRGLTCRIETLKEGSLAEWGEEMGLPPLKVVVGVSASNFQATDDDFMPLSRLTEVKYISSSGCRITDKALSHITGLKKLEVLYVGDTQVTDRGLKHLQDLCELRELWLRGTRVTDEGMKHLKGLSKLESLLINRTDLSDRSLKDLSQLTSLTSLDVSSTSITDAGLLALRKLKNLKFVNLYDTKGTAQGISDLKEAMPELKINTEPPPRSH